MPLRFVHINKEKKHLQSKSDTSNNTALSAGTKEKRKFHSPVINPAYKEQKELICGFRSLEN